VKRTRRQGQLIVEPRSMLVAESDLLIYSCRVVGSTQCRKQLPSWARSVLRHCAVGAGRLRPLVGHAVGISASFFRRRSNPHPRRYIDHRLSARSCGFILPVLRWRGWGRPAPIAPPQKLVVTGLYRYVRNPIYIAVVAVILVRPFCLVTGVSSGTARYSGFFFMSGW